MMMDGSYNCRNTRLPNELRILIYCLSLLPFCNSTYISKYANRYYRRIFLNSQHRRRNSQKSTPLSRPVPSIPRILSFISLFPPSKNGQKEETCKTHLGNCIHLNVLGTKLFRKYIRSNIFSTLVADAGPPLPLLFVHRGRGTSFITVMHKPP